MRSTLEDGPLLDVILSGHFVTSNEIKTASGAASLNTPVTAMNSSSPTNLTLAAGLPGQIKLVVNIGSGECTIIPSTFVGDAGLLILQREGAWLQYIDGDWMLVFGGRSGEAPPVVLNALSLDTNTINEGDPVNTLVGTIQGKTTSSTITLQDSAGGRFKVVGNATVQTDSVATDFETATTHNITLRETLVGASNTPRDTVIAVSVQDVLEGGGVNLLSKGDSVTNDSASYARLGAEDTDPLLVYQNRAVNGTSVLNSTPNWIGQFAADMAFFDGVPDSVPKIWSVMLGNTLHHSGAATPALATQYFDMIRRHANNVKVFLVGDFDRTDTGYRSQRTADEAWAAANVGIEFDGFVSMKTGLPGGMGADGASENVTWYPTDGTHPGPLIHEAGAPLYTAGVDALSDDLLNGTTAPVIVRLSPLDGATLVQPDAILVARFNKHMKFSGNVDITIFNAAGDTVVEAFDETDIGVGIVLNGVDLTITPTADLPTGASLYVQISAVSLLDISDNAFAGITNTTTWNFALPSVLDLTENLMAFWELEEASGTRVDAHGANDLTDNNTVTQAAGKVGNAASFLAASTEFLSIADNADLRYSGSFSVCGWIYRANSGMNIAGKGDNAFGQNEWSLFVQFTTGQALRFLVFGSGGGSSQNVTTTTFIPNDTWVMACATYNAATRIMSVSLNAGTRITGDQTANGAPGSKAFPFNLGAFDGVNPHNGRLDQWGFWKEVLSPEKEAWLYNSGNGRTYAEIAATA